MRRFRLGLRSRVTVLFALGGLVVAALLAVITLAITRQALLSNRADTAQDVVFGNAARVVTRLTSDLDSGVAQAVLDTLNTSAGSRPLLEIGDTTRSLDESFTRDDLPASLQALVRQGEVARIRTTVQDVPAIVYAIPIDGFEQDVYYYEAVPLGEVEDTLGTLQYVLLGGALIVAALSLIHI